MFGSYSLSFTVTFGCSAWKPSASFWNSGVVARLHAAIDRVTDDVPSEDGCSPPPLLQPLKGDLKGMPPLLIQIGEREALYDDSKNLADAARAAGVEVEWQYFPGQIHDFQMFGHRLDEARTALKDLGTFIRKRLDAAK